MRSYAEIMSLYPRCARCEHRAEDHLAVTCGTVSIGRCPRCAGEHVIVHCECRGYVGPTLQEFCDRYLTPAEAHLHFPLACLAWEREASNVSMGPRTDHGLVLRRDLPPADVQRPAFGARRMMLMLLVALVAVGLLACVIVLTQPRD